MSEKWSHYYFDGIFSLIFPIAGNPSQLRRTLTPDNRAFTSRGCFESSSGVWPCQRPSCAASVAGHVDRNYVAFSEHPKLHVCVRVKCKPGLNFFIFRFLKHFVRSLCCICRAFFWQHFIHFRTICSSARHDLKTFVKQDKRACDLATCASVPAASELLVHAKITISSTV